MAPRPAPRWVRSSPAYTATRSPGYIELGVKEGPEFYVDAHSKETLPKGNGFFLAPCIFDNVTPEMRIYREEIFGPVLSVLRVPGPRKDFSPW